MIALSLLLSLFVSPSHAAVKAIMEGVPSSASTILVSTRTQRVVVTGLYVSSGATFAAPVTLVGSETVKAIRIANGINTSPELVVISSGPKGTSIGSSGGAFFDFTNSDGIGAQFYSGAGARSSLAGILNVFSDNTAFNEPLVYIKDSGLASGAPGIRIDGPDAQIEWVETDQSSPAGKFEDDVNNDLRRWNSRNSGDNAFETAMSLGRLANGGNLNLYGGLDVASPATFHSSGTALSGFGVSGTFQANNASNHSGASTFQSSVTVKAPASSLDSLLIGTATVVSGGAFPISMACSDATGCTPGIAMEDTNGGNKLLLGFRNRATLLEFFDYSQSRSYLGIDTSANTVKIGSGGTPLAVISTGTYTPVATSTSNIDSITPALFHYFRIGNTVQMAGYVTIDPTSSGANTVGGISLPIPSNFTLDTDANCTSSENTGLVGFVGYADATRDNITLQTAPATTASKTWWFHCMYIIQ